jgi:drug/metabolite transporter (DMT)-like permease
VEKTGRGGIDTGKTEGKPFLAFLIFLQGSIWGLSFLATNIAVKRLAPIQVVTLRWTFAAAVFVLLALTGKVRLPRVGKGWKFLLATGLMEPCLYGLFETEGIRLTSTSESAVIIGAMPAFTLLIGSVIRHKKSTWLTVAGIFISFFGIACCTVLSPGFTVGGRLLGYLELFVAMSAGAAFMHLSSRAGEWYGSAEITAAMSFIGCVFFNLLNLAKGYGPDTYRMCLRYPDAGLACLFLGLLCSSLCYLLMNFILSRIENTAIAANLSNSWTTVVGVLSGILIMHDAWGWYTAVGLILALGGMAMCARDA